MEFLKGLSLTMSSSGTPKNFYMLPKTRNVWIVQSQSTWPQSQPLAKEQWWRVKEWNSQTHWTKLRLGIKAPASASDYLEQGMLCGQLSVLLSSYYSLSISRSSTVYAWNVEAHCSESPLTQILENWTQTETIRDSHNLWSVLTLCLTPNIETEVTPAGVHLFLR